ncbi:MAG: hypothetical protein VX899_11890 [Myxococcota bacterium]|nr:hypothetical protein [Myxococcota bacterium]
MILLLLATGCVSPSLAQEAVTLSGQASLSVDHWRGAATLRIQAFLPAASLLPEERQGIPMDGCRSILPESFGNDLVFRKVPLKAVCAGVDLRETSRSSGLVNYELSAIPPTGTICHVEVGDQVYELPPLPSLGAPQRAGRELTWEPSGADEVRVVTLGSGERSHMCRSSDDGQLRLPRKMRSGTTFVTWHNAQHALRDGQTFALSATVGTWLQD